MASNKLDGPKHGTALFADCLKRIFDAGKNLADEETLRVLVSQTIRVQAIIDLNFPMMTQTDIVEAMLNEIQSYQSTGEVLLDELAGSVADYVVS